MTVFGYQPDGFGLGSYESWPPRRVIMRPACRLGRAAQAGAGDHSGRMVGALVRVCEQTDMCRPHILFWGHEPRADGWTDPDRIAAYMYSTATDLGTLWRVPDAAGSENLSACCPREAVDLSAFGVGQNGDELVYDGVPQAGIGVALAEATIDGENLSAG